MGLPTPSPSGVDPPALFISGWWYPSPGGGTPSEVGRNMAVLSREGASLGNVAAVAADPATRAITQLVLSQCPPSRPYRLVPAAAIAQVAEAVIQLRLSVAEVEQLPYHQPA